MFSFLDLKRSVDITKCKLEGRPIGKSTFGVVYKAVRSADKKHPERQPEMLYAVKKLKASAIQTRKGHESFLKEVRNQADLNHIGILSLVGYTIPMVYQDDYSIITQFMPNGSLLKLIEKVRSGNAPDDWETIKAINIFGIAAAMAYAHQHKIIHRDLKPGNVILDENNYPKIDDFGLSKVFDDGKQAAISQTLHFGTPVYMAPELFDNPHYTNKVDVFSYSLILYEIITWNKPWYDKGDLTVFSLLKYVKDGLRPTIRNGEIPDIYVELIKRCWDGNPDERPTFKEIVKDFLDRKEEYFDLNLIDECEFEDYIDEAIKGIKLDDKEEEFE